MMNPQLDLFLGLIKKEVLLKKGVNWATPALAELSTRQIAEYEDATGLEENKKASKVGGKIAKRARLDLEAETGKK
jgi:hypothetical protein